MATNDQSTIAVVLNPVAGGGKGLGLLPRINTELTKLKRPYQIHVTTAPGDALATARRFACEGAGLIISVGGDGTLNEVINGILESGQRVPFGLVSAGHGGDFARTAGTSKHIDVAVQRACSGRTRAIDAGRATFDDGTSRAFINVAGLGFDALVAERVQKMRLPGSTLPYLAAAFSTLATFKNIEVKIDADGAARQTKAVFVQIANAKYMGGGLMMAPDADIEDGDLQLAIIGDFKKPELLRALPGVYKGKHVNLAKFSQIPAKRIRVETMQPAKIQVDGEMMGAAPVTFTVEPGALQFAG
jgi:YegS/Rv2252/BmrU family lipid kinase